MGALNEALSEALRCTDAGRYTWPMLILGLESSCDETGVALYDDTLGLLGHALHSQAAMHAAYGGVVPELASRDHVRRVLPLLNEALRQADRTLADVDAIAYTQGPGLAGALLVGTSVAKGLAFALGKPAIGVHHLEGHLLSPLLADPPPSFPFVALLVSGGHTQLLQVDRVGSYVLLGDTLDDAAGEAFDKSAQVMGLGYPGGPMIAARAAQGQAGRFKLPRPLLHQDNLDFSFAGLKTAVLTQVRKLPAPLDAATVDDLCAEVEAAIVDVLVAKSIKALHHAGMRKLVVAGGVGANQTLRRKLTAAAAKIKAEVYYPAPQWCTDNGAMIALAGALRLKAGGAVDADHGFGIKPRWPLEEIVIG